MRQNRKLDISSAGLHMLAMGLMLCDHLWAMLFPAEEWLTCVGRAAFPIFAFMTAEGYRRTHELRRYLLRMLGGYYYEIQVFGMEIEVVQQGFALLALIPIWLYQGRKGLCSKAFRFFCYAFYPVHMLLLFIAREWILR